MAGEKLTQLQRAYGVPGKRKLKDVRESTEGLFSNTPTLATFIDIFVSATNAIKTRQGNTSRYPQNSTEIEDARKLFETIGTAIEDRYPQGVTLQLPSQQLSKYIESRVSPEEYTKAKVAIIATGDQRFNHYFTGEQGIFTQFMDGRNVITLPAKFGTEKVNVDGLSASDAQVLQKMFQTEKQFHLWLQSYLPTRR